MIDFSKYTLQELQAIDNFLCYTRAMAAEHIDANDILRVRRELMHMHRSLSRAINKRLDEEAEQWDISHGKDAGDPPAPPAEDPDDLQALVDTLSRCSDQLVALALAEDKRFTESGQTDTFIKLTVLRNANRSIIDMLADIRDHYYFELKAPTASDDTAPPDMFGWVGDALDDLCAAGEVIGNDR